MFLKLVFYILVLIFRNDFNEIWSKFQAQFSKNIFKLLPSDILKYTTT